MSGLDIYAALKPAPANITQTVSYLFHVNTATVYSKLFSVHQIRSLEIHLKQLTVNPHNWFGRRQVKIENQTTGAKLSLG